MTIRLSQHFTLDELVRSSFAVRNGIDNTPPPNVMRTLERLANEVLEPIRRAVARPMWITSGYRSYALNELVGGARGSAHLDGRAADFVVPGLELFDYASIVRQACEELPVGKLIQEFPPHGWMHVQIEPLGRLPRRIYLTATRLHGSTEYRHWA